MKNPQTNNSKIFYNLQFQAYCMSVLPGEYYVTGNKDEMIMTILGSCVSACIRDTKLGIGGMNHFLLAEASLDILSQSTRYGSYAMECLINEILKQGGKRENLEVKIFGGSDLMNNNLHIGKKNTDFIQKYLKKENIPIAAEDIGGKKPRRIHYWPHSGRVLRLILQNQGEQKIAQNENMYASTLKEKGKNRDDIELFI